MLVFASSIIINNWFFFFHKNGETNSSYVYMTAEKLSSAFTFSVPMLLVTHTHRSIGYLNRNTQLLDDSVARLMDSRVYDNRDNSHQSAPSPSLYSSLTHAHNTLPTPTLITITCTQVIWFLECLTRPAVSFSETTRTRFTISLYSYNKQHT
jgi:hypothetical protein